jgi:hypothetical protein
MPPPDDVECSVKSSGTVSANRYSQSSTISTQPNEVLVGKRKWVDENDALETSSAQAQMKRKVLVEYADGGAEFVRLRAEIDRLKQAAEDEVAEKSKLIDKVKALTVMLDKTTAELEQVSRDREELEAELRRQKNTLIPQLRNLATSRLNELSRITKAHEELLDQVTKEKNIRKVKAQLLIDVGVNTEPPLAATYAPNHSDVTMVSTAKWESSGRKRNSRRKPEQPMSQHLVAGSSMPSSSAQTEERMVTPAALEMDREGIPSPPTLNPLTLQVEVPKGKGKAKMVGIQPLDPPVPLTPPSSSSRPSTIAPKSSAAVAANAMAPGRNSNCLPIVSGLARLRRPVGRSSRPPTAKRFDLDRLHRLYVDGFQVVRIGEIRKSLVELGVDSRALVNISFVNRGVVELVVDVGAKPKLVELLEADGFSILSRYSPECPADPTAGVNLKKRFVESCIKRISIISQHSRNPLAVAYFARWSEELRENVVLLGPSPETTNPTSSPSETRPTPGTSPNPPVADAPSTAVSAAPTPVVTAAGQQ